MPDSIQHQLIAARKNQILDAAAAVFAEKGFHPTTIRDIAKQAGIADGTIYNYFDSKPALLMGIFERMRDALAQETPLLDPTELDLRGFLRHLIAHPLMALRRDNFALFRIMISEMMVNEELRGLYYQQMLYPGLAAAKAIFQQPVSGLSQERADLVIRVISGLILGLMVENIMGDTLLAERWDDLPDLLTDLLLDGLMGDHSK
jgi:TetR/AcrR family fatty acid metabolism transcriptional regulator